MMSQPHLLLKCSLLSIKHLTACVCACVCVCFNQSLLQVILRTREDEIQFLRQEAHSLREELKIAQMVLPLFI